MFSKGSSFFVRVVSGSYAHLQLILICEAFYVPIPLKENILTIQSYHNLQHVSIQF